MRTNQYRGVTTANNNDVWGYACALVSCLVTQHSSTVFGATCACLFLVSLHKGHAPRCTRSLGRRRARLPDAGFSAQRAEHHHSSRAAYQHLRHTTTRDNFGFSLHTFALVTFNPTLRYRMAGHRHLSLQQPNSQI
jgi:hypothetical protein